MFFPCCEWLRWVVACYCFAFSAVEKKRIWENRFESSGYEYNEGECSVVYLHPGQNKSFVIFNL